MRAGEIVFTGMDRVVFGRPAADAVVEAADRLGARRVFILASATLNRKTDVVRRIAGSAGSAIGSDFVAHFIESYRLELAAWASASLRGEVVGASSWDGYVANLVAAAGVRALGSGAREEVDVPARPGLYA